MVTLGKKKLSIKSSVLVLGKLDTDILDGQEVYVRKMSIRDAENIRKKRMEIYGDVFELSNKAEQAKQSGNNEIAEEISLEIDELFESKSEQSAILMAEVICFSICNEDGTLQFDADDLDSILSLPSDVISDWYNKILTMNAIDTKDEGAAEQIKN